MRPRLKLTQVHQVSSKLLPAHLPQVKELKTARITQPLHLKILTVLRHLKLWKLTVSSSHNNCLSARVTYHDGFAKTQTNLMQADKSRTTGHYVVGKNM